MMVGVWKQVGTFALAERMVVDFTENWGKLFYTGLLC